MYRGPAWEGLVLPYEQVNKGKLEFLFVHDALKYLSKCRRLERLELINVGGVNENAEEPPPLNSGIRFLSVRASDQVNLTSIFEYTTLPQLCTIDISGKNGYPSTHWPTCDFTPIHECLLRSSCTITTFHLKWLPTSDEQVLSLLRIMPALEVLQIDEIPFQYSPMAFEPEVYKYNNRIVTPTFLTHLAVMDRDSRIRSSFLPRLKELSLCIRAEEAIDSEALLHVITTRGLHHRDVGVSALTSFELTVMANGEPHASFGPVREVIETFRSVGQLRAKMLVIQV
ncbi:hypothetical protein MPER_04272 [Moniliophthora perniciosa FA553]|nr:hypothetical protein MPER_04272 [Moniliophthora perniciosa FA553]